MKKVLFLSIMLVVVLSLVSVVAAQDDYKVLRVRNGETDQPTMDPNMAEDAISIQTLMLTTPGVTVLANTGEIVPGIASSWDGVENADGTYTWTFYFTPEIPWVRYNPDSGAVEQVLDENGNPRYVTAYDMEYGMMRAMDPALAAPYASTLYGWVLGGEAYYADPSDANKEALGINVIDEYTLAITAPSYYPLTAAVYGYWVARPAPRWAIEEYAEAWIETGNHQSYGPYTLKEWVHGEYLTVVKNPFWPGNADIPQPDIDEIQMFFVDLGTGQAMYEAGELDFLDTIPRTELDRIFADADLSQQLILDAGCSQYLGFNTTLPPTDNVHMRRALSFAIDRDAIVSVLGGIDRPAQWFTLPEMNASPTIELYPDLGVWYDPAMAQEELALYMADMGYTDVSQIPPITLLFNTNATHATTMPVVQQSWIDTLGLQVELANQEFAVYLDARKEGFAAYRAGWCMDVPDTDNFLFENFTTTASNNDTHWGSEEFDALVTQARFESDTEVRRELYAQAENILVFQDVAIAPTYWGTIPHMVKPYVEYVGTPDNAESYYLWTMTNP